MRNTFANVDAGDIRLGLPTTWTAIPNTIVQVAIWADELDAAPQPLAVEQQCRYEVFVELYDTRRLSAAWLYMAALGYCGKHELPGFVPGRTLRILGGRPADADPQDRLELRHRRDYAWDIDGWREIQQDGIEEQQCRWAHAHRAAWWDAK